METCYSLTTEDLRNALLRHVKLPDIESTVLRSMKLPSPDRTASTPLFALRRTAPELSEMVARWMQGSYPAETRKGKLRNVFNAPYCPSGLDAAAYLKSLTKKIKPCLIAVDACPLEIGAALHYACSLYYGLQVPARVGLAGQKSNLEEITFQAGDFLPEITLFCFQNKIPLVPLSTPARFVPSEHQFTYHRLLNEACNHFILEKHVGAKIDVMEKTAANLMQHVFSVGFHLAMEREDIMDQSCYIASRLFDLVEFLSALKYKKGPVLTLYKMKNALDFPSLVKTFWGNPSVIDELYSPLQSQPHESYELQAIQSSEEAGARRPAPKLAAKIGIAVQKFLAARQNEPLGLDEVDEISSSVAGALRNHALIERPPGVRGTLATREIAQGYGLLRGVITRQALAQAACIALRHRTGLRQGEDATIEEIFKDIFSKFIFGIPLQQPETETARQQRRPLTPEEISKALMGLSDAAFRRLSPDEGLPLDDPAFAEAAMNHPLVQQALKDAMEKGLLKDMLQGYQELLNEIEDRDYLDLLDSAHMTLSREGQKKLKQSLEEALARGEISPEDFADILNNAGAMPALPGLDGDKIFLPPQAETEMIAELMDFQHEGKSSSTSLEDLYVHYTLNEKKGVKVSPEKVDYEKLKILIHQMEKKGILKMSGEKKRFSLSHSSLERLLEGLIRRQESQVLERRAFRREHETDKTEIRRYKRGDLFNDLSIRHTLRRIIRKGKSIEDINYTDLRSFEKKPSNQLDIAICVDISASMKENAKLRYAKMAVAELGKAAITKNDRVGIVAFSNLGQVVVPLTDKITPLLEATMTLSAEQYTNIGNGLLCARRMLLKNKDSNPKYIILITDGQPNAALSDEGAGLSYHSQVAEFSRQTSMETKQAMGTRHALSEALKTSRRHIKISVIFISPAKDEDAQSEKTAREIARIGAGRFHKVKAIERLPLEALAAVG